MSFKNLFLSFIFLVFLSACNQNQPDFIGSWKLSTINIGGDIVAARDIDNPTYVFNDNNIYEINVNGVKDRGSWKLEGEYLILQKFDNHEVENKLKIVQSTPALLQFSTGEGDNTSVVTLIK